MIPTFAVVGHPNKGKSSIVATLAEDERVAIGATPGTTREARPHTFVIDGEPQYVLVDTPGFQRAGAVLDWLVSRAGSASERPALVAEFVVEHRDDPRFRDECELLTPIVDGAGILYVVDGAKPYGKEYELEMQILRWTGRPRLALINTIGPGDYRDEWRQALDQYFSIVREFDAMNADFTNRVNLLRAFAELDERWRGALGDAIDALTRERARRRARSARAVADMLIDCLGFEERAALTDDEPVVPRQAMLVERLQQRIAERERDARHAVQSIYRWAGLESSAATSNLLQTELFTSEGFELFGLSQTKLALSGAVSGALAGGGVDAMLGGASLLLGTTLGALVGGVGAWFGGRELARVEVLGETLGGRVLHVGPVTDRNFPWVLLGRAWVHQHLVAERNHARREAISLALGDDVHVMDVVPEASRRRLAAIFRSATEDAAQAAQALETEVDALLALELPAGLGER